MTRTTHCVAGTFDRCSNFYRLPLANAAGKLFGGHANRPTCLLELVVFVVCHVDEMTLNVT